MVWYVDRDKRPLEVTALQLKVLLSTYITSRVSQNIELLIQSKSYAIASAALEKKGLITRYRNPYQLLYIRITKKGSRLLAIKYPLETIHELAVHMDDKSYPIPWLRRAMQYMLLRVPLEQYPELLISKSLNVKELAIKQWGKLNEQ